MKVKSENLMELNSLIVHQPKRQVSPALCTFCGVASNSKCNKTTCLIYSCVRLKSDLKVACLSFLTSYAIL